MAVVGKGGVICIEAGGPKPGIGCAGRGIITTFSVLEELGMDCYRPDYKVVDVLGDVVCGGFAIPMRPDYTDGVCIVTSGEFMSLYAANNILKGLTRFCTDKPRILGLVFNSRGDPAEERKVEDFAEMVELPIIAKVPRSKLFKECERSNSPIAQQYPDSDVCAELEKIADLIVRSETDGSLFHEPKPLSEEELEAMVKSLRRPVKRTIPEKAEPCRLLEKNTLDTCSAAGAVDIGFFIDDMEILLHTPRSCAYIMGSFHDRMFSNDWRRRVCSFTPSGARLHSTDITDICSIFGGTRLLREKLEELISSGKRNIMVISTCMAGIIGDDIEAVSRDVEASHPGTRVVPVKCDGNQTGHMGEGLYMATRAMFRFIDLDVEPREDMVNILGFNFTKLTYRENDSSLRRLLDVFGLKVNCKFIGGCTTEQIVNLRRGRINLLAADFPLGKQMANELKDYAGIDYLDAQAPFGYDNTVNWLRSLGKVLGKEKEAEAAIEGFRTEYESHVESVRRITEGHRVAIYCDNAKNVKGLVELVRDLGMELVYAGFGPSKSVRNRDPVVGFDDVDVRRDYLISDLKRDFPDDRPELIISRSEFLSDLDCRRVTIQEGIMGIDGVISNCDRIVSSLLLPRSEGWRE